MEVFDKDLQLTLSDIRGHFGVSGGSLKVGGKVKVVKPDVVVPSGTYVLDIPQRNQGNYSFVSPFISIPLHFSHPIPRLSLTFCSLFY